VGGEDGVSGKKMEKFKAMQATQRGLFPEPERCLYFVDFAESSLTTPIGLFPITLMAECVWHYKAGAPLESYFEKNGRQFPIADCASQHIDDSDLMAVIAQDDCLVIGLTYCPADAECAATLREQGRGAPAVNDEDLLKRKRENQEKAKKGGPDRAGGF